MAWERVGPRSGGSRLFGDGLMRGALICESSSCCWQRLSRTRLDHWLTPSDGPWALIRSNWSPNFSFNNLWVYTSCVLLDLITLPFTYADISNPLQFNFTAQLHTRLIRKKFECRRKFFYTINVYVLESWRVKYSCRTKLILF